MHGKMILFISMCLFHLQVAGLISCVLLLIVLLAIGPYFRTLPNVSVSYVPENFLHYFFLFERGLSIVV